jgi:hypothetical protein
MKIIKSDLLSAVEKGVINENQAQELWEYFESSKLNQPKFQLSHILYNLGGFLILASMLWFFRKYWSNGGSAIMFFSSVFAISCLVTGNTLSHKKDFKIPAEILISLAVYFVPLFIHGFQLYNGLEDTIYIELGAIIASVLALRYYKFPFLVFPLASSLWWLVIHYFLLNFDNKINSTDEKIVSCIIGLITLIISYFVDRKYKEFDFAFWGYLVGIISIWGVLISDFLEFYYLVLNIFFMIISIYLRRKVFFAFGVIGAFGQLAHSFYVIFKGSFMLPLAVAIIGFLIIFLGIKYQRNRQKIEAFVENLFPRFLLKWRPEERV